MHAYKFISDRVDFLQRPSSLQSVGVSKSTRSSCSFFSLSPPFSLPLSLSVLVSERDNEMRSVAFAIILPRKFVPYMENVERSVCLLGRRDDTDCAFIT